ncbi:MAG TPA: rhodanese-like sulfurtransferase, partial [Candidatus Deferrimicrobiaceae bacterium]|nr:rhodanese-like sulfurtransferase [Candidatus Deferrimicrobiaceae bacterium]
MTAFAAGGEEAPRMTKEQLKGLLGNPDLIVIDVRWGGRNAPEKIPAAVFEDP